MDRNAFTADVRPGGLTEGLEIKILICYCLLYTSFSMTCPNCGAPIRSLGSKVCEFCETAVQEVNHYAWSFDKIYEFDK